MKKTLIALAVAASAVVSGSAMAWTANGTGGTSIELGGTLTPVEKMTPWEVQIGSGAPATALDAQIQKGQQTVNIAVKKVIPVLGIRTQANKAFSGQAGISPQIDFKGAINLDAFNNSRVPLTLTVTNGDASKNIGSLTVDMAAQAIMSVKNAGDGTYESKGFMYAPAAGYAFFGGIAKNADKLDMVNSLHQLFPGAEDNFDAQGLTLSSQAEVNTFRNTKASYSAAYGAAIEADKVIKMKLDAPAAADAIAWKASLPITVSYQ